MAENSTFDFASRDYDNIRRDLLNRASRTIPEWVDRDPADFGVALVDLWAYMGDILHYYVDRAANESFLTTATQRESVLGLANLFDYTPRFRSPAQGTVYVTNTESASTTIPAGTKFSGTHNDVLYLFYSTTDVVVGANSTVGVDIYEGSQITEEVLTSSSDGTIGQRYALNSQDAVASDISVYVYEDGVNPTQWTQVTNVNSIPVNVPGFSVYPNANGKIEIVFGNRISGRIPPVGAKVTASYATCSGADGNLPANKVTSFFGSAPAGINIANSSSLSFGSDIESVSSIKTSIKSIIKTQDRAVTLQDFADYASQVFQVYKAMASYSASSSTVTVYAMPYVSDYLTYSGASVSLPTSVKTELETTLQSKALLGVTVAAASGVNLRSMNITGTIYVDSRYVATRVKNAVINAINGLFELDELEFGKEVKLGEIYRTAMSVEGVDYVEISSTSLSPAGSLAATEFLKKGTFTFTTSGGITTSV